MSALPFVGLHGERVLGAAADVIAAYAERILRLARHDGGAAVGHVDVVLGDVAVNHGTGVIERGAGCGMIVIDSFPLGGDVLAIIGKVGHIDELLLGAVVGSVVSACGGHRALPRAVFIFFLAFERSRLVAVFHLGQS